MSDSMIRDAVPQWIQAIGLCVGIGIAIYELYLSGKQDQDLKLMFTHQTISEFHDSVRLAGSRYIQISSDEFTEYYEGLDRSKKLETLHSIVSDFLGYTIQSDKLFRCVGANLCDKSIVYALFCEGLKGSYDIVREVEDKFDAGNLLPSNAQEFEMECESFLSIKR